MINVLIEALIMLLYYQLKFN